MEPREHLVRVAPDVDLRVLVWAPEADRTPNEPAFLLVHGLASNAWLWAGVAEELAAAGHLAVAVDLRGHGASSAPDDGYDFATVTADLAAVIGALDLHRPVVAGQSWGGNVVLELGRRHGDLVAGVVCVDGGHIELAEVFPSWEQCRQQLTPPPLAGTPLDVIERSIRARHADWPESGIRGTLANFDLRADGTVAPHLSLDRHLAILRHLYDHHPPEVAPEVEVPVLLLPVEQPGQPEGAPGKAPAVDRLLAALPDGRVRWFTGDHDVHAQSPDEVAAVMLDAVSTGWLIGSERGGAAEAADGAGPAAATTDDERQAAT